MSDVLGLSSVSLAQMSNVRLLGIILTEYFGSQKTISLSQFASWKFGQILSYSRKFNSNHFGLYGTVYFTPSTSTVEVTLFGDGCTISNGNALQNVSAASLGVVSTNEISGHISIAFYDMD